MLAEYDSEQSALEGRIEEIKNSITEYEKNTVRTDKFMEVVRKYQDCEEITTPMLNEFIEKIVVHEADKSGGRLNRNRKAKEQSKQPTVAEGKKHRTHSRGKGDMEL